jgi:hypothetical protein
MYQEPGIVHKVLEYSDDYTAIEIAMPADFPSATVPTINAGSPRGGMS